MVAWTSLQDSLTTAYWILFRANPSTARFNKTGFWPISAIKALVRVFTRLQFTILSKRMFLLFWKKILGVPLKTHSCSLSDRLSSKVVGNNFYHGCVVRRVYRMGNNTLIKIFPLIFTRYRRCALSVMRPILKQMRH